MLTPELFSCSNILEMVLFFFYFVFYFLTKSKTFYFLDVPRFVHLGAPVLVQTQYILLWLIRKAMPVLLSIVISVDSELHLFLMAVASLYM